MFTQPLPSQATSSPSPVVSSHASVSSRSSRLRGLSYLRNYTHSHLLSRDQNSSASSPTTTSPRSSRPLSISALSRSSQSTSPTSPTSASATPTAPTVIANFDQQPTDPANSNNALLESSPTSTSPTALENSTAIENITTVPNSVLPSHSESQLVNAPRVADAISPVSANGAISNTHNANTAPSPQDATMPRSREPGTGTPPETLPSIRFSAYYDARAARPSLSFQPVSRTLPTGTEVIKVGRYSERDAQPLVPANTPSAAPVGFKSKVVSRRHCEFWFENGKWYIKDVKSSSGTFLNHIRLSPPGTESRPYAVNDGDIIQLGIDFKGGEEMIFRCVKMRLELNRGWQNKLNTFNMSTHKRLRNLVSNGSSNSSSQDCSICLNSIAPCQSLFVAPCSHTWHYKCIRSLLTSPQYPIFVCPNCRAAADLEAEVDEPCEEWQQLTGEESANDESNNEPSGAGADATSVDSHQQVSDTSGPDVADVTMQVDVATPPRSTLSDRPQPASDPVPIPPLLRNQGCNSSPGPLDVLTNGNEGPITPRNNAGPWVFDGSAGVVSLAPGLSGPDVSLGEMRSIDSAAMETAGRS
ncbi:hypothetical protein jhhlp_000033 [Lomentospora prolificans]|uniref:RING-type E3 ubiquitin transferase n=1 Tax=Lomentospora prolificans TaxID=41688 RepID=A0A2N3NLL6_9PEZI|nr:hypothetical protein jhhlp_000033 [Lomentospora prolificans]